MVTRPAPVAPDVLLLPISKPRKEKVRASTVTGFLVFQVSHALERESLPRADGLRLSSPNDLLVS